MKIHNLKRQHTRFLKSIYSQKDSVTIAYVEDDFLVKTVLKHCKLLVEQNFSKDSKQAVTWESDASGLLRPMDQSPRHHTVCMKCEIELTRQVSRASYNKISELMFLPTYESAKHTERKFIFGEGGMIKGFHHAAAGRCQNQPERLIYSMKMMKLK